MNKNIVLSVSLCLSTLYSISTWASENSADAESKPSHPNVVVIVADDMGWNDVGYNGSEIRTPNLDQLAQEGVRLDRFYVQPSCSPTRTSLMTAQNNQRLGIYSPLSKLAPSGLPLSEKILPQYFKEAGYQTFMVGKWHLGFRQAAYRPDARGFDYFYGNLTGGIGYWNHIHGGGLDLQRNGQTLRQEGYITHLQAAELEQLIEQRDPDKPMFLYASFNAPHLPNEAPKKAVAQYSDLDDPLRAIHAAMVSELDKAIGRVIQKLEDEGILDNTLIWFMSDNGGLNYTAHDRPIQMAAKVIDTLSFGKADNTFLEFLRVNVLEGRGSNLPYKRGKESVFEGGVHVPALVYWKNHLSPNVFSKAITVQDVLPSLLEAAQLPAIEHRVDGKSTWNVISGNAPIEEYSPTDFVTTSRGGQAYYQFPWKLIARTNGDYELYQLDRDPTENNNIADAHPQKMEELKTLLAQLPRGESVHVSVFDSMLNMDFFGGEESGPPWNEVFD